MELKWDEKAEEVAKEKGIVRGTIERMLSTYFNSIISKGVNFYVEDNMIFVGKEDEI